MTNDLVTPENLSVELLNSIFDDAYMETSIDSDGDLHVRDDIGCFVILSKDKDRITLLSQFGFESGATHSQRLECVNNINKEMIIVKAYVGNNDSLRFEYDICLKGGVTKKNIVQATKKFLSIPRAAVINHGEDLVEWATLEHISILKEKSQ